MSEQGDASPAWNRRRRRMVAVGGASLLVGVLLGAGLGAGEETPAETVTEVRTVTETEIRRVPVVKVRTVEKVRRVVRTETVTVEVPAASSYDAASDDVGSYGGGNDYAGLTCSEIGHSFQVEPGSDPAHDADNDGIACESY